MEGDADGFRSEKMEGDRKFQRGNLSEDQNMSEVQILEVQNLTEENKRKRKRREFLRNLF